MHDRNCKHYSGCGFEWCSGKYNCGEFEKTDGCKKCKGFIKSIDNNYCSNCGRDLPDAKEAK